MYAKSDFLKRFSGLDTESLVDKLANQPLTDDAQEAIIELLEARGVSGASLDSDIRDQKQAFYRRTGVTNTCDRCGKSVLLNGFTDEGQRFCSQACHEQLRCLEATANTPQEEILAFAKRLRSSPCPQCRRIDGVVEARKHYWVWSALVVVNWGHETRIQCRNCGAKDNLRHIASGFFLGPWSIKGLFLTPVQIIRNIDAMVRKDPSMPSEALLGLARLRMGRALIDSRTEHRA